MNTKALLIIDMHASNFTKQKLMYEENNLVGELESLIINSERKQKNE